MASGTNTILQGADLAFWRSYLLASRLLFERLDQELQSRAHLSLADFTLLMRLAEAGDDGIRMSDLADSAVFSRSRLSHAVTRLEKSGWVERRSCPTDRRGSFAALTEEGSEKLGEANPIHSEVVREHLIGAVPEEDREQVHRTLVEMTVSLGGQPGDPAC